MLGAGIINRPAATPLLRSVSSGGLPSAQSALLKGKL